MMKRLAVLLFAAVPLCAQTAHEDLLAIQDNSFLLEEAYNQTPGVVQHIGAFTRAREGGDWELAFTQEFPLFSMQHQLSYSVPLVSDDDRTSLGDVALNYRYQLVGDGDAPLAITPRLSLIVPVRNNDSSTAIDAAIAISRIFAPRIAGHTNAGITFSDGEQTFNLGQSFVYAPSPRYQLLLEGTYSDSDEGDAEVLLSPGVRWVYNRASGWQIVPGVAVPIGVGPAAGDESVLLYLSFEK